MANPIEHAETASGLMELLQTDTNIWVLLSFALFLICAFIMGRRSITDALDSRIQNIKEDIENAERLRVEAQELLAQYQRKQRDAEKESAEIIRNAKAQAKTLKLKMEQEIADTMERRESQLTDRLKRLEENAIAQIQDQAADLAVAATAEMIVEALDQKTNQSLTEEAIKALPKQLN